MAHRTDGSLIRTIGTLGARGARTAGRAPVVLSRRFHRPQPARRFEDLTPDEQQARLRDRP